MSKVMFGTRKDTGEVIYLTLPTWDCGWYWSFGYLGNKDCHYHLSSYQDKQHVFTLADGGIKLLTERRNKCMYDCLLEDYELNPKLVGSLWRFCELAQTAYALKDAAKVLGRGGSHITTNPCADVIKSAQEVERINRVALPAAFAEIEKLFK